MTSSAYLPHLLAFIVTARYVEEVETVFYLDSKSDMMELEDELGVGTYFRSDSTRPKALDLKETPGTLTSLDHVATTLKLSENIAVKFIKLIDELMDDFGTLGSGGMNMELRARTSVLQLRADELGAQIQAMKGDVQSMVQMV
jgi:hypothetical protein